MRQARARHARKRLFGALLSTCLFVQPLAVHWHLATADHTHGPVGPLALAEAQPPGPLGHAHPHEPPHVPSDASAPDREAVASVPPESDAHPPHPASDHLVQLKTRALPIASLDLQPMGSSGVDTVPVDVSSRLAPVPERRHAPPRAPPWRASAGPRAPPAAT